MICDTCQERDAVVHLTRIVDNAVTQLHLCEKCAAAKGVETTVAVAQHPLGERESHREIGQIGRSGQHDRPRRAVQRDLDGRFHGDAPRDRLRIAVRITLRVRHGHRALFMRRAPDDGRAQVSHPAAPRRR